MLIDTFYHAVLYSGMLILLELGLHAYIVVDSRRKEFHP